MGGVGMKTALAVDTAHLKSVLGRFCTGVTAVTAMTDGGPVGFTCQSFSALSLEPPYVCVCPGKASTSWPRIREVGEFCVNILAEDQSELGQAFARSGAEKFAGVRWGRSPNGSPLIAGAMAWVDCSLEREVDGGDHTIVIARVTDLSAHRDAPPLLFYRSSFERLAQPPGHWD
jgi:3-hydroxy-9,10-secoandrosta-1,3,5(10)-triene-9,17-dione monooxygenase reductase component